MTHSNTEPRRQAGVAEDDGHGTSVPELATRFSNPPFLAELHRLLWIKPFVNRGTHEFGWCCRDHALTLGLTAAMQGYGTEIVSGEATFVSGPGEGVNPVGIEQKRHSWLRVEGQGTYDASWRLDVVPGYPPEWRSWNAHGIFAEKCRPANRATFICTRDSNIFLANVNAASHLTNQHSAVYFAKKADKLTRGLVDRQYDWVNSPLTDKLRKIAPQLYAAAALHLFELIGGADPLPDGDQKTLWKMLSKRYRYATQEVYRRIEQARRQKAS